MEIEHMMKYRVVAATLIAILTCLTGLDAWSQNAPPPGIKRIDLLKQNISAPGREVVQVVIEFEDGATAPRHAHPGDELVFMLEGSLDYAVEGQQPTTLKVGQVLLIPQGAFHSVKNVSGGKARELATYIVETGKPLLKFAD
jgi:quercetin dioxygenase-like cupin family protein